MNDDVDDGLLHLFGDAWVHGDVAHATQGLAFLVDSLRLVGADEKLLAQLVNRLALLIHHVVVFEQMLANIEVSFFDFPLRVLDALRYPGMNDGFIVRDTHAIHQGLHSIARENAHQVVFE